MYQSVLLLPPMFNMILQNHSFGILWFVTCKNKITFLSFICKILAPEFFFRVCNCDIRLNMHALKTQVEKILDFWEENVFVLISFLNLLPVLFFPAIKDVSFSFLTIICNQEATRKDYTLIPRVKYPYLSIWEAKRRMQIN